MEWEKSATVAYYYNAKLDDLGDSVFIEVDEAGELTLHVDLVRDNDSYSNGIHISRILPPGLSVDGARKIADEVYTAARKARHDLMNALAVAEGRQL